jgi:hypothetical protein
MSTIKPETSTTVTNETEADAAGEPAAPDAAEPAGAGPKKIGRDDMDKVSGGGWGPQTSTSWRVG